MFYLKSGLVLLFFLKLNAMWFDILSNAMTNHTFELQPQIRKSWDSMENANKKRK